MRSSSLSDSSPRASADTMRSEREEQQAVEHLVARGLAEGVARDGDDASAVAPAATPVKAPPSSRARRRAPSAFASRTNRSSSDSRRGVTDSTEAPADERRAQKRVDIGAIGQLQRDRPIAGRRGPRARGQRQRADAPRRRAAARPRSTAGAPRAGRRAGRRCAAARRPRWPPDRRSSPRRAGCASKRRRSCPRARSSRIRSRTSLRPSGSRPVIGSSRITSSGSPIRACAMPIRCSIPFENLRSGRPRRVVQADARDQPVGARAAARPRARAERADEVEELLGRQVVVEVGGLGQVAQPALGRERRAPAGPAPRRAREAGRSGPSASSASWSCRRRSDRGSRRSRRDGPRG